MFLPIRKNGFLYQWQSKIDFQRENRKYNLNNIIVLLIGYIDYDSRVQKEISNFISLGYNVTLVVWKWMPSFYVNDKIKIVDVNLSNYKFHTNIFSVIKRFFQFIQFWFIASKIIKRGNYKYIHCNDLITLGVILFLTKKYYKNVIYDAHDLCPERYKEKSIKYKIWSFIEKYLIKKINTIIVPELHRSKYLKNKYNLKNNPYVINNYPEYKTIIPKNIKAELNISKEKKIICYSGVIMEGREIENIIESLRFLPEDFILLLIGYAFGDYIEKLKQLIIKRMLEARVFFYGKVPPKEMLQCVAGCDISITLYKNNRINNYLCASNKVFDSIMAGVKILTNDYPPHSILKKYGFVSLLQQINPKEIAKSIRKLAKFDSEIPEKIKQQFSWESFFELFKQIYR